MARVGDARAVRSRPTAPASTAPHTTTGSVWLIALSPLLVVVVAIAVGYFYFYVDPQPLVLAVGAIPILLGLLWAITDSRKLRDWGNEAASGDLGVARSAGLPDRATHQGEGLRAARRVPGGRGPDDRGSRDRLRARR